MLWLPNSVDSEATLKNNLNAIPLLHIPSEIHNKIISIATLIEANNV